MPQQPTNSVQNNFSKGLITEATGLNFPPDAVTDADNCIFNRIGNVTRRPGLDYEASHVNLTKTRTNCAIALYKWNNAGGQGDVQLVVTQVGNTLYFYKSYLTTDINPLSNTQITSVDLSTYQTISGSEMEECQFSDGNGFLFVFHPKLKPIYCTYAANTVTPFIIDLKIRDFAGIPEPGVKDQDRSAAATIADVTAEHQYNLQNQGWGSAPLWTSNSSSTVTIATGSRSFTIDTGLTILTGEIVQVNGLGLRGLDAALNGSVTSYNSGSGVLVLNVTSITNNTGHPTHNSWNLFPFNAGLINTWITAEGTAPSNADVWWRFKNSSGVFDPATTQPDVTLNAGAAPKGYYILNAFDQNRTFVSGISSLTSLTTLVRPRTGVWFGGRVWYAGVDASQAATGDQGHYSWSENIYFSQTIVKPEQFGLCHQVNDPTTDQLFAELPTDGGVLTIQGSGSVYKLFPLQNGLLVFTSNGIWYITGSQGIGFAANDYTITKISSIQAVSHTSFVDVQGFPMWWNSEGIYIVSQDSNNVGYGPTRGGVGSGGLSVQPITFTTIQSYYDDIPHVSKRYAHGIYDPLNWEVRWIFKSTVDADVTDRYKYDRSLVYNVATQSFYPWSYVLDSDTPYIAGLLYVQSPASSTSVEPAVKYYAYLDNLVSFAEDYPTVSADWTSVGGDDVSDFNSYFTVGYRLTGQASHKFQVGYLNIFLNAEQTSAYKVQAIWDYANTGDSGKYTTKERIDTRAGQFSIRRARHKIRGRGFVVQFKVTSVDGVPFDIIGWAVDEKVNQGL